MTTESVAGEETDEHWDMGKPVGVDDAIDFYTRKQVLMSRWR